MPITQGGAALGAAVAGAYSVLKEEAEPDIAALSQATLGGAGNIVQPMPEDIAAYHGDGKYLAKFAAKEADLIAANPIK